MTIYNKTSKPKTFSTGTILVGPENLRFVLADEVTVASSSAQTTSEGQNITFGKETVKAVAGDIGAEYNTKTDTELSFKDYDKDQFSAKVSEAFTGGTSSEKRAVAKEDQKEAIAVLTTKLETQAKAQIQQEIGDAFILFDSTKIAEISDEEFDSKVGEEADNLTITGTLTYTVIVAPKNDFELIVRKALAALIPTDFVISEQGLSYEVVENQEVDEGTTFTVKTKAKLMPKLNFAEIKSNIVGKYPLVVEEYFKSLPNFARTRISVTPALPGKLGTLPRKPENIAVSVEEAQ